VIRGQSLLLDWPLERKNDCVRVPECAFYLPLFRQDRGNNSKESHTGSGALNGGRDISPSIDSTAKVSKLHDSRSACVYVDAGRSSLRESKRKGLKRKRKAIQKRGRKVLKKKLLPRGCKTARLRNRSSVAGEKASRRGNQPNREDAS